MRENAYFLAALPLPRCAGGCYRRGNEKTSSAVAAAVFVQPPNRLIMLRTRNSLAPIACVAIGLSFSLSANAQTTGNADPSADAVTTDEAIQLSPFEVTTSNRGYLAPTALSGTRLNTRLEDIASSITVVTKQQMLDTASTDINDVFLYEASTEGTGNYTSFTANRDGGVVDNVQADPSTANRVRGLGSANIAISNFPANPRVPTGRSRM